MLAFSEICLLGLENGFHEKMNRAIKKTLMLELASEELKDYMNKSES